MSSLKAWTASLILCQMHAKLSTISSTVSASLPRAMDPIGRLCPGTGSWKSQDVLTGVQIQHSRGRGPALLGQGAAVLCSLLWATEGTRRQETDVCLRHSGILKWSHLCLAAILGYFIMRKKIKQRHTKKPILSYTNKPKQDTQVLGFRFSSQYLAALHARLVIYCWWIQIV